MAGKNAASFPEVYRHTRRTPLGIVFCDPQAAFAGQTYAQLIATRWNSPSARCHSKDQGRSRVMLVNQGLLRVYGEHRTGLLLGAEMIGPENEHLAHLLAWVIQMRMTVAQVIELPFYHPVIEEGLRTALRHLLKTLGMGPKATQGMHRLRTWCVSQWRQCPTGTDATVTASPGSRAANPVHLCNAEPDHNSSAARAFRQCTLRCILLY